MPKLKPGLNWEASVFKKAVFPGEVYPGAEVIRELPTLIDLLGKTGADIGVALGTWQDSSRLRCRLERSDLSVSKCPRASVARQN